PVDAAARRERARADDRLDLDGALLLHGARPLAAGADLELDLRLQVADRAVARAEPGAREARRRGDRADAGEAAEREAEEAVLAAEDAGRAEHDRERAERDGD